MVALPNAPHRSPAAHVGVPAVPLPTASHHSHAGVPAVPLLTATHRSPVVHAGVPTAFHHSPAAHAGLPAVPLSSRLVLTLQIQPPPPLPPPPSPPPLRPQAAVAASVAAVRAASCVCVFFSLPPPPRAAPTGAGGGGAPPGGVSRRRGGWGSGGAGLLPSPLATVDTGCGPVAVGVPHYCPAPSQPVALWLAGSLAATSPAAGVGSGGLTSPHPPTPCATSSGASFQPRPLWVVRLHAPSLHPLGFDILEALGGLSPTPAATGKGGEGGGAGGLANAVIIDWAAVAGEAAPSTSGPPRLGGAMSPPAAPSASSATFSLDSLPLNTLIVTCDDGCYLHPNVTARLRGEADAMDAVWPPPIAAGGPSAALPAPLAAPAVGSSASSGVARMDVRRLGDTLLRLLQLRRETWDSERKEAAQLASIATRLAVGAPPPHLHGLLARVERLRHVRDALLADATQRECLVARCKAGVGARWHVVASHAWLCCDTPTQHANPPVHRILPRSLARQRLRRSTLPPYSRVRPAPRGTQTQPPPPLLLRVRPRACRTVRARGAGGGGGESRRTTGHGGGCND
jgi:hypothetical protein